MFITNRRLHVALFINILVYFVIWKIILSKIKNKKRNDEKKKKGLKWLLEIQYWFVCSDCEGEYMGNKEESKHLEIHKNFAFPSTLGRWWWVAHHYCPKSKVGCVFSAHICALALINKYKFLLQVYLSILQPFMLLNFSTNEMFITLSIITIL